jgi:hypothetical protein
MSQGRNHNESWGHVTPASLSVHRTPCLPPYQRRSLSPTNQQPSRPNIQGYNSTNAPRHLNNAPVLMDVDADRTHANRNNNWRNRNPQGRTVQMQDE